MEGLINKLKKYFVSKIQNIRITGFTTSLIVNGKGMIKSITYHIQSIDASDELIIIIDDEPPLVIKLPGIYTDYTYQGLYHFVLNETISFDKKFEIKTKVRSGYTNGFATYTIE